MLLSFTVYTFILLSFIFSFNNYSKTILKSRSHLNEIYFYGPIIIFTLFMGIRYGVGVDYFSYLKIFENARAGIFPKQEWLFAIFTSLIAKSGLHFSIYFAFFAGLQALMFFLSFKKNEIWLLPFLGFTLITSGRYIGWMNVIRQNLVFTFFVFSIPYIIKKRKWFLYLAYILVLTLIHKSALILVVVYPLIVNDNDYCGSIIFQLFLFILVIFLSQTNLIPKLISIAFNVFNSLVGYSYNFDRSLGRIVEINTGLGVLVNYVVNLILIIFSKNMKIYYKNTNFNRFYQLFFYGELLNILIGPNIIFSRPFLYFYSIKIIVVAYFLHYSWVEFKKDLNGVFFIGVSFMYILIFLASNFLNPKDTTLYNFFWQFI